MTSPALTQVDIYPKPHQPSVQTMGETNAEFERVVSNYYQDLYRFAYSLARNEADATDLTQQTFFRYASKGHTIRERSKTKSWLFRTLKNEFLNQARRSQKYQHVDIDDAEHELPRQECDSARRIDSHAAVAALSEVDETYRIALSLFYMKGLAYKEIAEILEVPIGTVMSRISRGKAQLKQALAEPHR